MDEPKRRADPATVLLKVVLWLVLLAVVEAIWVMIFGWSGLLLPLLLIGCVYGLVKLSGRSKRA
jgi:hypothetical protein